MSLHNLCDDVLIEISIWCDLITLIQLIRTKKQFSDLFSCDCVWKHKINIDFQSDTLKTSHYLFYQFLFKKANFLRLIQNLDLSVKFNSHASTLLELDKEINSYWLKAVNINGYILQYVTNQTEAICLVAVKQ